MKRLLVLLLCALLLTGCSAKTNIEDTLDTTPTNPVVPSPSDSVEISSPPMPMITVSVPITKNETTAEDGTVIFRDVRQSMQLVMPDQEVADQIIINFLARIDQAGIASADIASQAQGAYTGMNPWTPYLNSTTYAPTRIDQSVLSLYGSTLQYNGGAHAVYVSRAANYNTATGDVLTLGSILVDESALEKLCTLVISQLDDIKEEKYLRSDFADTVHQRFATDESYDENWYFSNKGLCFYFDHYAIAPYSSGVITAEIPYADLVGIIDDAFFPPELEECSGVATTIAAENADMTKFTRISEVIVDTESPMYVIQCSGNVQNLRITLNDAELGSGYTIFAAQTLCHSDAIVIQAELSLFRNLDITYESSNQTVTIPLFAE